MSYWTKDIIYAIWPRTFKAINNIKVRGAKWIITATPIIKAAWTCAYLAFLRVYPWVTLDNLPHHEWISRGISSIMYALSSYSETYPNVADAVRKQVKMTMFYRVRRQ